MVCSADGLSLIVARVAQADLVVRPRVRRVAMVSARVAATRDHLPAATRVPVDLAGRVLAGPCILRGLRLQERLAPRVRGLAMPDLVVRGLVLVRPGLALVRVPEALRAPVRRPWARLRSPSGLAAPRVVDVSSIRRARKAR